MLDLARVMVERNEPFNGSVIFGMCPSFGLLVVIADQTVWNGAEGKLY